MKVDGVAEVLFAHGAALDVPAGAAGGSAAGAGPLDVAVLGLVFWRNYPPAVAGMMVMLTGDGMAEVVGKLLGRTAFRNPWGRQKTAAGALAVLVCGAAGAMAMCSVLYGDAHVALSLACGAVGAAVEFFAPPNTDNVLIPLAGVLVGVLGM